MYIQHDMKLHMYYIIYIILACSIFVFGADPYLIIIILFFNNNNKLKKQLKKQF